MCIPYTPRDHDVVIRLTSVLLDAWTDNRDNLVDLCGSVHSSAARTNLQSRESLVRDTKPVCCQLSLTAKFKIEVAVYMHACYMPEVVVVFFFSSRK